MVQTLLFYKIKLLSENATDFSRENIYESIKNLLKGSDRVASDMIHKYFEEIIIDSVDISYEKIIKIDPNFEIEIKRIFDKTKSNFFLVDENMWYLMQEVIDGEIANIYQKELKFAERLNEIANVCQDYSHLKEVYEKKLLMADII
ncbi:hypothetical protein [Anabaena sp. AL93]|uniref:hypothetical protein n=1 Tax=Anabaena sp. AL93 TaxID=1678133 RepID=UPI0007FE802B|nr:hypothetical protein [Anabaena sp. AL93]OBQ18623.1 MAG: hypothetical protein AN486_11580 [Anabaena sp. AL93]